MIFPHQLFADNPCTSEDRECILIEEHLFFNQYSFHKQKLAFHRASMKKYANHLSAAGKRVRYIDAQSDDADVRQLMAALASDGVERVHAVDPVDDWLGRRLARSASRAKIEVDLCDSPGFLNTREDLRRHFAPDDDQFHQTKFYIAQRKKLQILLDDDGKPQGGKWSFDAENRKKYPRKKTPPQVTLPDPDSAWESACEYVERHYASNPGSLGQEPLYATDAVAAKGWLQQFLDRRFAEFGDYEDAIVEGEGILHHSVLTPMLNVGLLTPEEVVAKCLDYAREHDVPINSVEGFIRQIIGWREFIRGVYVARGRQERTRNFWGFDRSIPASFYDGTTGIPPVDATIRKVLKTGYCHHIERLMILGNFMLLCEFDPDEVYRWFMELFIDAYDWVMVPNVYGMSQFADGGLLATKPYISGSNYVRKMSDYPKGDWQQAWDGLFWRFMHVHRETLGANPRLGMLLKTWERMDDEKKRSHLDNAESFLQRVSDG